uniref:Beta-galactosidase n=2 Tax=Lepisosteus oculatus TaxID=7918 RepID=W5M551_LEPOC
MIILSIRNAQRRRIAAIGLILVGVITYYYIRLSAGGNMSSISRTVMMKISRKVGLEAESSEFTLGGEKFRILGGSVHYFRVPRAYWRDRMKKMKACGLNTLTTYVPWNLHEPERGRFDFKDQLDLEAFINLAADVGLWVILRPGPYICSEWDLGGLPSWLLRDKDMRLRTTYEGFTEAVDAYFDRLIPIVAPLQFKKGGPIIAFQVENEYGSYAMDEEYMPYMKKSLLSREIDELLMTSDNKEGFNQGGVEGALATINLQKLKPEHLNLLEATQPQKPKMVMEYWTGWFDSWGDLHHVFPTEDMAATVTEILKKHMSINLYMFHGGTNFGFMSGALEFGTYKPDVVSYDYDAPLSEAGDYTEKYHLLRNIFSQYHTEKLPLVPALSRKAVYETSIMYHYISMWEALQFTEEPFKSERPVNMENLPVNNGNGQSYGYTLYETTITSGGTLHSNNSVRDRALVFVDQHFIGILKSKTLELAVPEGKGDRKLSLLVENCGRVNYGKHLDDQRKGLVGDILLNNIPLKKFFIYSLDMKPSFIDRLSGKNWKLVPEKPTFPGFFQGRLFVDGYPRDTFVKLPGWTKGVVFINGQNLGRYWSIGPQQTLYLPGPWLNSGMNQIIVFEEQEAERKIQLVDTPDLGMAVDIE